MGIHRPTDIVTSFKPAEFPYLVPLSMAELGRGAEALAALREVEPKIPTRVRDLMTAARFLLEGKAADSYSWAIPRPRVECARTGNFRQPGRRR
jgi:hypothetical protein